MEWEGFGHKKKFCEKRKRVCKNSATTLVALHMAISRFKRLKCYKIYLLSQADTSQIENLLST